jgi:hypothetical protein
MLVMRGLLLGIGLTFAAVVLASLFFVVLALGSAFVVTAIGRLFRGKTEHR